jgi:hypothetical protein
MVWEKKKKNFRPLKAESKLGGLTPAEVKVMIEK